MLSSQSKLVKPANQVEIKAVEQKQVASSQPLPPIVQASVEVKDNKVDSSCCNLLKKKRKHKKKNSQIQHYQNLSVKELKDALFEKGHRGHSRMPKEALIALLIYEDAKEIRDEKKKKKGSSKQSSPKKQKISHNQKPEIKEVAGVKLIEVPVKA